MPVQFRDCIGHDDDPAISDFLFRLYRPENRDGNWFQPIFEYAVTHPWFDESSVSRIGLWEDGGRIVAASLYELTLGEAFFAFDEDYRRLKPDLLDHAERRLVGNDENGRRFLKAFVNDFDTEFEELVRSRGYELEPGSHRPMSRLVIPDPFPRIHVPDGFRLKSLADDNDLAKADRVLWRGFNHPGEPPEDGIEGRRKMQSGPHFREDLTIVVEGPRGDFAAFAGLWFEPVNRFGYVEPVCTDPDYRRRGLGTAAVMEGVRRCGELGAKVAYVGTDKPFYLSMGFEKLHAQRCWIRYFD